MQADPRPEPNLFAAVAAAAQRNPNRIAIEHGNIKLTYAELLVRVEIMSRAMIAHGVEPHCYVGVHLEPSLDMIATIMAILKTGAAYVPIDKRTPNRRIGFIAADTTMRCLVTDEPSEMAIALPVSIMAEAASGDGSPYSYAPVSSSAPAYVIYTSGSSGQPKGVICSHYNVWRLLEATDPHFNFSTDDRWTLFHSIAFDFSVWEIFGALVHGGTLVIVPTDMARDTRQFATLLEQRNITVLNQTPSAFGNLLDVADHRNSQCLAGLRFVILGGERVKISSIGRWFDLRPQQAKLINMYGITETTVHVTYRELTPEDLLNQKHSPVGVPIQDLVVHLLNEDLQPVPPGAIGEICVAGAGVTLGYLNRPELTRERFITNPYAQTDMQRTLYRSGDLGRLLPNGDLLYIGRRDRQVKIRGYRIELGEVENALLNFAGVSAHVFAHEFALHDTRLIAGVIPDARAHPAALRYAEARHQGTKFLFLDSELEVAYINRAETLFMYKEIFIDGQYDSIHFTDDSTIIDVGANIGMFSLFALTRCRPARIVAVEPIPACYAALRENLGLYSNGCASVHAVGIADREMVARFRYFANATVLSGQYAGNDEADAMRAYLDNRFASDSASEAIGPTGFDEFVAAKLEHSDIECPMMTLSMIIDREGLSKIDVLKIDAEKSEMDVLRGIRAEHWPLIQQLAVEVHDMDGRLEHLQRMLQSHGFLYRVVRDPLLRGTSLCNVFASRPSSCSPVMFPCQQKTRHTLRSPAMACVRDVQTALAQRIPPYMIPAHIALLTALPLTINGKVDETVLVLEATGTARTAAAVHDAIERQIKQIWLDALKIADVDTNIGLAAAGAHSLAAVVIAMRIQQTFQVALPMKALEEMSISDMAAALRACLVPTAI